MPDDQTISCPKCGAISGDDWSQCGDGCPMPGSPVHSPEMASLFDAKMPAEPDPSWPPDMQPTGHAYLAWRPVDHEDGTVDEPIAIARQMAGERGNRENRSFLREHHAKNHSVSVHNLADAVAIMSKFEEEARQTTHKRRRATPF